MKFLFDLDGTVTSKETLPIIAEHFGVQDQIAELTPPYSSRKCSICREFYT